MRQYLEARKTFSLCVFLGAHGFMSFPSQKTSFQDFPIDQISNASDGNVDNYAALLLFIFMQFFVTMGVSSIPNIMLGEVFPFK